MTQYKVEAYQIQTRSQTRCYLSEVDRLEIMQAIDLGPGHWYSCLNGHIYCVGECGGPVESADCPECGEPIGKDDSSLQNYSKNINRMMDSTAHKIVKHKRRMEKIAAKAK